MDGDRSRGAGESADKTSSPKTAEKWQINYVSEGNNARVFSQYPQPPNKIYYNQTIKKGKKY